jgi:hypothetical protein
MPAITLNLKNHKSAKNLSVFCGRDKGQKKFFHYFHTNKKNMKSYLLPILVLFSGIMQAQNTKLKIGSDKGVKEAFIKIKNGLPDIKKNLTIKNKQTNKYGPKFSIGGQGSYREEDGNQHLTFTYSFPNYTGAVEDYQNYYKTLVSIVKEVFGTNYAATESERGNVLRTAFYENGKNVYTSTTSIYVKFDGTFESSPSITVEISSEGK